MVDLTSVPGEVDAGTLPDALEGVGEEAVASRAGAAGIEGVVMGTHGRTGIDRVVLGSVTERVVRASEVPVLTVHMGG